MIVRKANRSGFTLLEVLLASVIALLLLSALYYSLDIVLKRTELSRDNVASDDLARAVVNRMNDDFSQSLGPLPPKSGGDTSAAAAPTTAAPTTGTATPAATGAAATPTGTTTATATPTDPASTDPTATDTSITGSDVSLQSGMIGSAKQLTLFMSRIPTSISDTSAAIDPNAVLPSDLRRVTYYLASDGKGLCRQERPWVTADGVRNSTDPDRSDELGDLIAPEVIDLTFEYFDGSSWAGQWDGTLVASDGITVTGPPRAVRVTFVLEVPSKDGTIQKRIQHVFVVRSANGAYVPPTTDATTDAAAAGTTATAGGM